MSTILSETAHAAHSWLVSLLSRHQITRGERLPDVGVKEDNPEKSFKFSEVEGTKRIIIVGVPGAFTPPCSSQVPGYIDNADKFAAKGVSGIYIVAVNDAFVTKAWKEKLSAGKTVNSIVHFIADDQASFTSGVGLLFDASGLLGGPRAKRYVIVAENGVVERVAVEEDPTQITVTDAATVLAEL